MQNYNYLIYTIGYEKAYEENFKKYGTVKKLGKQLDYEGGSVWKTKEEAAANCPEGYKVYGVKADYDLDTHNGFLLISSLLVRI